MTGVFFVFVFALAHSRLGETRISFDEAVRQGNLAIKCEEKVCTKSVLLSK